MEQYPAPDRLRAAPVEQPPALDHSRPDQPRGGHSLAARHSHFEQGEGVQQLGGGRLASSMGAASGGPRARDRAGSFLALVICK